MKYGAFPTRLLEGLAYLLRKVPFPVLDVLVGPIQARALIAAESVGALAALAEGPTTAAALAGRLGVDAGCLTLVLRVLRGMGYLALDADRFSLTALGRRHFGPGAAQPYHAFVGYGRPQWDMVARLEDVLRTGQGIDFHATHTPGEWASYQRAMVEYAASFAWFVADHVPVPPGAKSCLDLAGSHGLVGAELCRRHPGLRSTVLDLPPALQTARPLAEERGHAGSVSFREGNLLTDDYGADHDVVLLCNILHHFPAETNAAVLEKARAALRPGGSVAIFDLEAPEAFAPPDAAGDAFALYFRITSTSACFRAQDYEQWLAAAGFRGARTIRSPKLPSRMLVVAQR